VTTVAIKGSKQQTGAQDKLAMLAGLSKGEKGLPIYDSEDYVTSTQYTPSGSLALDAALGGGYPSGSIFDVFGAESAGKSLLSILAMAEVQKRGGIVAAFDAELSYTKKGGQDWLKVNGVDPNVIKWVRLAEAQGAEIGLETLRTICRELSAFNTPDSQPDLAIVDSVPSLIPNDALGKSLDEHQMLGRRASLIGNFAGLMVPIINRSKTMVFVINQIRANIVSGPAASFAPKTKETSNFSLKHFSTIRLKIEKMSKPWMENDLPGGHRVRVTVVKNKVSRPGRVAEFDLSYTTGVDTAGEVADLLVAGKEAKKKGAWIEYDGIKANGRDDFKAKLRDPKVFEKALKHAQSLIGKVNVIGVQDEDEAKKIEDSPNLVLGGEDE
jgi:recombination protein RecA